MAKKQTKKVEEVKVVKAKSDRNYKMTKTLKRMLALMGLSDVAKREFISAEEHHESFKKNQGKAERAEFANAAD